MYSTFNEAIGGLQNTASFIRLQEADGLTSLNYAELRLLILGNAEQFSAQGVRRGDPVAISLNTDLEHIVAFLALVAIGAIPVSVKPARTSAPQYAEDLARLCRKFNIRYAYHTLPSLPGVPAISWDANACAEKLSALAEVEPCETVFVQFSSGSTTEPKPIPITHANLMANLSAIASVDRREPQDTTCNFLPLSHDMGLVGGLLCNLVWQNSTVLMNTSYFLRRPIDSLEAIYKLGIEGLAMPDFALRFFGRYLSASRSERLHRNLLSRVRIIYCGAEPIKLQTIESFLQGVEPLGLNPRALFFCYGLAEATLLVSGRHFNTFADSFDTSQPQRVTARLGPPLGGTEIRICSPAEDNSQPPALNEGQEGAVQLRGQSIFAGYWGDAPRAAGEWFDTGDVGYMRGGELYICGRTKEMLIVNGENIFPPDIESVLSELEEVKESLAIPDAEQLYVLVVPATGAKINPAEISSLLTSRFGVRPKAVVQATPNQIVRTTSGKPVRGETLSGLFRQGLIVREESV